MGFWTQAKQANVPELCLYHPGSSHPGNPDIYGNTEVGAMSKEHSNYGHQRPPATKWFKRPMDITDQQFADNWSKIFGKKEHTNKNTGTPVRALDEDK